MSTITRRNRAARDGGSIDQRIARVLDEAGLAQVVPHLPPETLHQLVRYRGLADSGALLVAATPAQLVALADLDLWQRSAPGRDDRFDVARFGEWVEALVDVSPADAANTLAALEASIALAGLSRYVRVLDVGIFEPVAQSDDEAASRHEAMHEGDAIGVDADDWQDNRHECEIAGYVVRARRRDAWDGLVTQLTALHERHEPVFHRLMRGCVALSFSRPEVDGLDDLLMAPEQAAFDLEVAREVRRSAQGFATPADARAFLEMARQGPSATPHPIAASYLRASDDGGSQGEAPIATPDAATVVAAADLTALLAAARESGRAPRARLAAGDASPGDTTPARLTRLMARVHELDATAFTQRTRELSFLANVLASAGTVQGRGFTVGEASDAASAVCNLGLEGADAAADDWLVRHTLVAAFEEGWSVLYRDVCLFTADRLIDVLGALGCDDAGIQRDLAALRQALRRHRAAGAPWLARGRAEALAVLDPVATVAVQGLLGECPTAAVALRAVVEGRTTAVDPLAFAFIATRAQIGEIRLFLRMLPVVLTR